MMFLVEKLEAVMLSNRIKNSSWLFLALLM